MRARRNIRLAIAEFAAHHPRLATRLRTRRNQMRGWVLAHPRLAALSSGVLQALGLSSATPTFFTRASTLANTGRHTEAVVVLEAGLRRHRYNMPAHETLIQLLVHVQQYEKALQACVRALEIDAESDSLHASLVVILATLRRVQRPEDLIETLKKCAAVIPQNFDVVVLLLDLLVQAKRFHEAREACEAALRLDPEFLPALEILERMAKDPTAKSELGEPRVAEAIRVSAAYRRLAAKNVADFLTGVMTTFYRKLGTDPQGAPLVQGLERFRTAFSSNKEDDEEVRSATLIPFEKAWALYQAGSTAKSLPMFEAIFHDSSARKKAAYNPYVKVAVIRSGEIVARHHDTHGDIDTAIATYREIMSLDHNSIVAGRLLVLLARKGDLRGAANLAEDAIVSRANLYPRLPDNANLSALKLEIARPSPP